MNARTYLTLHELVEQLQDLVWTENLGDCAVHVWTDKGDQGIVTGVDIDDTMEDEASGDDEGMEFDDEDAEDAQEQDNGPVPLLQVSMFDPRAVLRQFARELAEQEDLTEQEEGAEPEEGEEERPPE